MNCKHKPIHFSRISNSCVMEYICLQGILVGVNRQPEDVAGGVCVRACVRARASYPPAAFFPHHGV